MKVHTYEAIWFGASLVLVVFFIASIGYGAVGAGVSMIDDSQESIDPDALDEDERFADPRVERVGENEYAAYVVAFQFLFEPDPIVVPANSTVTFYVTSEDVIHGFSIVGTNANTMVIPGEVAKLTVEVGAPAEYGILCNEYCGVGHHDMEGQLIVVPPAEFTEGES